MSSFPPRKIQVLYEISLSIRPKNDVETTAKTALSTYSQKLNCIAGAVYETPPESSDESLDYEILVAHPNKEAFNRQAGDFGARLPENPEQREEAFPIIKNESKTNVYGMELPGFGALVLCKQGQPFDDGVRISLSELNEKLAVACDRVRLQRQFQAQYRELFEEAPMMVAFTRNKNSEAIIDDCNHKFAETLGYDQETIRGSSLASFYTDESTRKLQKEGYQQALEGEFGTAERTFKTRDGREITTILRASPRQDRNGEIIGTHALYVNVTELKWRNELLNVLARILRHNFRNKLTVIQGNLNLAGETADEETRPHLTAAKKPVDELESNVEKARVVRQVLDEQTLSNQEIGDIIESLASRAQAHFPNASIETSVQPVSIRASQHLSKGLWELLENACMHGGTTPTVRVSVRANEVVTVTIKDDGPGVSESELGPVVEGQETQLNHGSGLGLWLAKWVIERSGGNIAFDTDDGTAIEIQISRAED